jgi:hypothetical protein
VGSGSGYVICSLALLLRQLGVAAQLLASDINHHAATATQATLAAHQVGRPGRRRSSLTGPQAHNCLGWGSSCCLGLFALQPPAVPPATTPAPAHVLLCWPLPPAPLPQVHQQVEMVLCDLASALLPRLSGQIDLLLFNPPYVPTPDEEVERGGLAAAWAGGARGRRVIDRLLAVVPSLLSPRGEMFMVAVHENEPAGGWLGGGQGERCRAPGWGSSECACAWLGTARWVLPRRDALCRHPRKFLACLCFLPLLQS